MSMLKCMWSSGSHSIRSTDLGRFSSTPQKSPLDIARFLAKDKAAPDSKAKYKDDPIYWQLTHRPFLLDSSSYAVPRRVQGPRAPTSQDLIDACNQHTVAAIEFFKGKGPVRDSGNVFDMIYSSNPKSGPIEVLDSALGLALQNEREEKINLSGKKGKDMAGVCYLPFDLQTFLRNQILDSRLSGLRSCIASPEIYISTDRIIYSS